MPVNAEALLSRFTDFAAAWLLTYLVHSTLILIATWIVTSRRRLAEATRETLWKTALLGGIVTASLQTVVAREPLGGQLRLAARTHAPPSAAMRLTLRDAMPGGVPRILVVQPKGTRWTSGLAVLWLTAAGAGLLWLTFGHARTLRVLGGRTPLDGTPLSQRMQALLARAGVRRRIELTCSSEIASPVALSGDEVCLPRRALTELESVEQDSMLAHEIAHLIRRDPQWLVVARVVETVLFVQPLNRLARHRMQESAEYLCDDWAVARTSQPVMLAKCLAAVAEWVGRAPSVESARLRPMSAMVESGGSPLVRRVGRILGERRASRARPRRVALATSACALAALAAMAPRISVSSAPPLPNRTFTFVVDSLVRQPAGAAAGGVRSGPNVIYRRISIDRSMRDSVATGNIWTRPLSSPGSSGAAAGRLTPAIEFEHESLIVVERRGDL